MTTPNNAAALERLEQKWRESAKTERDYYSDALVACANELATLRATLAQPDALTSQTSGKAGHMPPNVVLALDYSRNFANAKPDIGSTEREHIIGLCGLLERAYTHPSADAPGVAVDEWLPIESAPKDKGQSRMLLAWADGTVEQGMFLKNETWQGFRPESLRPWPNGQPTHWRPLPAPPAALAPKPEGEL